MEDVKTGDQRRRRVLGLNLLPVELEGGSVTSVYLVKFHLLTARGAHKGGGRAKGGQRRASEALSKPLDGRILVLNEHCLMIGCQCKLTTDLSRIREEFQQFRLISCHQ